MSEPLLKGLRVLELPGLGAACGRFLSSLGAEVIKLEPPGGEGARRLADGSDSDLWLARNLGKQSIESDLSTPEGQALARRLAASADVLIETLTAREAAAAGLDPAVLAEANPGLVQVSITAFGRTGPYAEYRGSELVASALGGPLWTVGDEDRPPVKEALDACIFHASGMASAGALFACFERATSGLGQLVEVSVQEVAASRCTSGLLAWQFDKRILKRTGVYVSYGSARVRYVWTLKDGYCFHGLMSGKIGAPANAALSAWMTEAGFENPMQDVEWERYDRSALPAETRLVWETAIDRFFRSLTREEVATEGRRRGINATVANEPGDILTDPHLHARGFFADVAPGLVAPSRFVNLSGEGQPEAPSAAEPLKPSPALWALPRAAAEASANTEPPLKGVKVLDFSWALVGSITTKTLADYGAEVIKVESSTRPCLSRIDVQVGVSKRGVFDDKPWFIHLNSSKQSLRLNMKREGWREVIEPLIDWADIVVENFSPGTMKSLGLDYETLKRRRPELVMVSGSVFGQTGPLAREWGVDGTGAALSGRLALTGWPDRAPVNPSAVPFGDVILPPLMAAAAVAALDRKRRTGQGAHIDASMYEACVQQTAGALIAVQRGVAAGRVGELDPAVLHQGVYPATGEERWVAVSATDAEAWNSWCALMGGEWPSAAELAAGQVDREALDRRIGDWTRRFERYQLMSRLQAAGVPAGVVQDASDLIERDPQLAARRFMPALENPVLGTFGHQATPFTLSRTPAAMSTAPALGQHTEAIVLGPCGMNAARYQQLLASGLFE